ncbi:hypothetical protein Golax_006280 [Gossypium laxum]|uniref:Uncharacterized protein n=1 Tax=Gossypium laxum TaxID=34288 RepID=A0A7J9A3B6_9ROSI|nr:hypothetical protein [Gossypium laxum]
MLYKEYDNVATMRLHFLASQRRRAEQFTVSSCEECAADSRSLNSRFSRPLL